MACWGLWWWYYHREGGHLRWSGDHLGGICGIKYSLHNYFYGEFLYCHFIISHMIPTQNITNLFINIQQHHRNTKSTVGILKNIQLNYKEVT